MQTYIPNLRAIEARYYGPTDTRGARVRLRDLRGILPTRWIDYDYAQNSAADTARAFLESEGWTLAHGAETPDAFLWLTPDFRRDSWTAPEPQEAARITCERCGGDNISQTASIMIDLKEVMSNTYEFDWSDLQWEDYFYCQDCADEVAVNEQEAAR